MTVQQLINRLQGFANIDPNLKVMKSYFDDGGGQGSGFDIEREINHVSLIDREIYPNRYKDKRVIIE